MQVHVADAQARAARVRAGSSPATVREQVLDVERLRAARVAERRPATRSRGRSAASSMPLPSGSGR